MSAQQSVKRNLLDAIRYLLKPVVRLALKNGILLPEFEEVLRHAFMDEALREIKRSGRTASTEAISLMINMDVAKVRQYSRSPSREDYDRLAQQNSAAGLVLSSWHVNPQYTGPYGIVLDLPFESESGRDGISFSKLAQQQCPDLPPRALLDELMRTDCVVSVGSGYFRAVQRSYIPRPLSPEAIKRFARIVHNLAETGEFNLRRESGGGQGRFERTIYTGGVLTPKDLRSFDQFLRERGQLFCDEVDNWLTERERPRSDGEGSGFQTGIGIYHYVVNDDDESDLQ
jgi:hypothetical protein